MGDCGWKNTNFRQSINSKISRNKHPGIIIWTMRYLVESRSTASCDFLKNFIELVPKYVQVENVHALVPQYLKESDAYKA